MGNISVHHPPGFWWLVDTPPAKLDNTAGIYTVNREQTKLVIEYFQEVKQLANFPPFVQELGKRDKEFYDAVTKVIEVGTKPGAVDEKTKVFISLALDAYIGSERGVMVLANRARELGATEEEINEVLRIPYYVAGSRPLITGNNAFPKKE